MDSGFEHSDVQRCVELSLRAECSATRLLLTPFVQEPITMDHISKLKNPDGWVLGRGPRAQELARYIAASAETGCPTIISGETGSGKEAVARLIHSTSGRSTKRFVPVNCPATPDPLFESLFWGKRKGSFTGADSTTDGHFQNADGGTLFLDEICELGILVQPKLLRAIQTLKVQRVGDSDEKDVDVHLVCATNRDLTAEIAAGRFRQDLFFRLAVLVIEVPPLRDRIEDLPLFVDYCLKQYAAKYRRAEKTVDAAQMRIFEGYPWPGNLRELAHLIEQAYVLDGPIQLPKIRPMEKEPLPTLNHRELRVMASGIALARSHGSPSKAARLCGVSVPTLLRLAPATAPLVTRKRSTAPSGNGAPHPAEAH